MSVKYSDKGFTLVDPNTFCRKYCWCCVVTIIKTNTKLPLTKLSNFNYAVILSVDACMIIKITV